MRLNRHGHGNIVGAYIAEQAHEHIVVVVKVAAGVFGNHKL